MSSHGHLLFIPFLGDVLQICTRDKSQLTHMAAGMQGHAFLPVDRLSSQLPVGGHTAEDYALP